VQELVLPVEIRSRTTCVSESPVGLSPKSRSWSNSSRELVMLKLPARARFRLAVLLRRR
jgi:hypothetical protein